MRRTLYEQLYTLMPPITALLHTKNDALRVGRALETLFPCSEILIVDHHSMDATLRVAHEYGARILSVDRQQAGEHYLRQAIHDWLLCLRPSESLSEGLQASLFEWSSWPASQVAGSYAFSVREQVAANWRDLASPQTRLVPRKWTNWNGDLPAQHSSSKPLEGALLRIAFP
jgi:glycosyltransferase involved in cell wall biosynthesis